MPEPMVPAPAIPTVSTFAIVVPLECIRECNRGTRTRVVCAAMPTFYGFAGVDTEPVFVCGGIFPSSERSVLYWLTQFHRGGGGGGVYFQSTKQRTSGTFASESGWMRPWTFTHQCSWCAV